MKYIFNHRNSTFVKSIDLLSSESKPYNKYYAYNL